MKLLEIAQQLNDIYYKHENWNRTKMPYEKALEYHQEKLQNGNIYTITENGIVLGYYERYFLWDTCFLWNIWVRKDLRGGKVFKELYRHFFSTLPKNINKIIGEKQKIGGKPQEVKIRRHDGKY